MINRFKSMTILLFLGTIALNAQQTTLHIAISRDTILLGNAFYVQYSFDMKDAQFVTPTFKGAEVISQNYMSNTSIINGEIKVMHRQRYLIQPLAPGIFTIPPTIIKSAASDSAGDLEIPAVQTYVLENPKKLDQEPEADKSWQFNDILQGKVSPKRKSKKI